MGVCDFDFSAVPRTEDDEYEFKSSRTGIHELAKKLQRAASGFANSGGGFFIAGVDETTGDADGGFPATIQRTSLRDWADQVLARIEPRVTWDVSLVDDVSGRGALDPDHVVLIVRIGESHIGPHMAPDHIYYIRAGAHTVPAPHFIVEAVRAKRHVEQPRIAHVFRISPIGSGILQLGLVAITDAPALDVSVLIVPWPTLLERRERYSPIMVPVITREHALYLDVAYVMYEETEMQQQFKPHAELRVAFLDLLGRPYSYCIELDASDVLAGARDERSPIVRKLQDIADAIEKCSKRR